MYDSFLKHIITFGVANTSIDRIDSTGNYNKANCKWVTYKEQNSHVIRNTKITYQKRTMNLIDWCRFLKIIPTTMVSRLSRGWTTERAFSTPVNHKGGKYY